MRIYGDDFVPLAGCCVKSPNIVKNSFAVFPAYNVHFSRAVANAVMAARRGAVGA
jgi:hypothetical protein